MSLSLSSMPLLSVRLLTSRPGFHHESGSTYRVVQLEETPAAHPLYVHPDAEGLVCRHLQLPHTLLQSVSGYLLARLYDAKAGHSAISRPGIPKECLLPSMKIIPCHPPPSHLTLKFFDSEGNSSPSRSTRDKSAWPGSLLCSCRYSTIAQAYGKYHRRCKFHDPTHRRVPTNGAIKM